MSVLLITLVAILLATTRWLRSVETLAKAEHNVVNYIVLKSNVHNTAFLLLLSNTAALVRWWQSSHSYSSSDLYYNQFWYVKEFNSDLYKKGKVHCFILNKVVLCMVHIIRLNNSCYCTHNTYILRPNNVYALQNLWSVSRRIYILFLTSLG